MPNVLEFIVQSYEVVIVQDDCACESRQASARSRVLPTSERLRTSTHELKARTDDNHECVGGHFSQSVVAVGVSRDQQVQPLKEVRSHQTKPLRYEN